MKFTLRNAGREALKKRSGYALAWAKRSGVARSRDVLMPISGYKDYKRREYCKDIACPIQMLLDRQEPDSAEYREIRKICNTNCIHSTYEFHHWLIENGYLIVRPEE